MLIGLPAAAVPFSGALAASPSLELTPATAAPGQSVPVLEQGFDAGVKGSLASSPSVLQLPSFRADRSGRLAAQFTVPSMSPGAVSVSAILRLPGKKAVAAFAQILATAVLTVVVPASTLPPSPPSTTPAPASAIPSATSSPTSTPTATPSGTPQPSTSPAPSGSPAPGISSGAPVATSSPSPSGAALTVQPTAAPSTTVGAYYVSPTGSDGGDGSINRPYRTLQHAASVVPAGRTILVRGGTYAGFDVTRSGLTFKAYPGETVVISDGSREDVIKFSGVSSGQINGMTVQGSTVQYGSGIKIKESSGVSVVSSTVRNNRTFGIVVVRSSSVRLEANDLHGNADGIEERYADNLVITGNKIHDNVTPVDSGRGAEGINFYKSTGAVTVTGNSLWNNGTHFEVYGASNLLIRGNVTWNGQIMETGTDGPACDNNRYIRNIGYRGDGFNGSANGMILRCASNNLIAHNTLQGFDQFAFDIVDGTQGVAYGGSIAGLRIVNNIVVGGRAFSIDSTLPASVVVDHNLVHNVGSTAVYGNYLAYVKGKGNTTSLETFRSWTGLMANGIFADPAFVDGTARDYRLRAGSPAIDRGQVVISDGVSGSAPDLGRYER